jgi:hypothetical protein
VKPHLLFADADFHPEDPLPPGSQSLVADLGLAAIFEAMAGDDGYLRGVVSTVTLHPLTDPSAITYRQAVLSDCLANREVVARIQQLAEDAIAQEKKVWGVFTDVPSGRLHRAVGVLALFTGHLRQLRSIADASTERFDSEGMKNLVETLRSELSDEYLAGMDRHLQLLRFRSGVLSSAGLGSGAKASNWRIHLSAERALSWWQRFRLWWKRSDALRIVVRPGEDDLVAELRGQAINEAAAALSEAMEHVLSFFSSLRFELGFYRAAANLHDRLVQLGQPTCQPTPGPDGSTVLQAGDLYDAGLVLRSGAGVVGNDLDADGKSLILVTGANQGGKSTFLRSLGLAQVMMQAGLFAPARSFSAPVRMGVFTHYQREEISEADLGKLEEELARMTQVVDWLGQGSLVLLNESFSSTNDAEGAAIASGLTEALMESGVAVACVTHSFELADHFARSGRSEVAFLRAERLQDGTRTFRMVPEAPSPASHAEDLYRRIFGRPPTGPSGNGQDRDGMARAEPADGGGEASRWRRGHLPAGD